MAGERATSRRRPPARLGEGGRRLHSAGSAILVSLAALVLSVFLNAPGIRKSAHIQPEGWKRDLALAVTAPVEDVSHALLLDRPRQGLKAALGRSDDDDIDTGVALPEQPTGPVTPPAKPPKRQKVSPARPLTLWVAGDSLVIVPGESVFREVASNRAIRPVSAVEGRVASGLERPDVYNWFTRVREFMRKEKPRAVVLMFGGNDDHGFMTGLPEGIEITSFGSSSWTREYRRRVGGLMDAVTRQGAFLVWIGLPITRNEEQTRRFDTINAILQSEAERRPGRVAYLDTYFFFAGENGGYAQYVTDDSGKLVKMRADDGVHFERPAGDLIAKKVLGLLAKRFDVTSWRSG